jgi:hypothetical protein
MSENTYPKYEDVFSDNDVSPPGSPFRDCHHHELAICDCCCDYHIALRDEETQLEKFEFVPVEPPRTPSPPPPKLDGHELADKINSSLDDLIAASKQSTFSFEHFEQAVTRGLIIPDHLRSQVSEIILNEASQAAHISQRTRRLKTIIRQTRQKITRLVRQGSAKWPRFSPRQTRCSLDNLSDWEELGFPRPSAKLWWIGDVNVWLETMCPDLCAEEVYSPLAKVIKTIQAGDTRLPLHNSKEYLLGEEDMHNAIMYLVMGCAVTGESRLNQLRQLLNSVKTVPLFEEILEVGLAYWCPVDMLVSYVAVRRLHYGETVLSNVIRTNQIELFEKIVHANIYPYYKIGDISLWDFIYLYSDVLLQDTAKRWISVLQNIMPRPEIKSSCDSSWIANKLMERYGEQINQMWS